MINSNILGLIGLAMKAGKISFGADSVEEDCKKGKIHLLIIAQDASERTQKPFWDKVLQECFKFYKIFNREDDAERFANYVKWKLYQMLYSIVTRIESDTFKMAAA